jgi:hypothetical protein
MELPAYNGHGGSTNETARSLIEGLFEQKEGHKRHFWLNPFL